MNRLVARTRSSTTSPGLRPGAGPHHAGGAELGRLADIVLGPVAQLVALVEQLDLAHLLERLAERGLGVLELELEVVDRAQEVLAPEHRRLGIGRIGEMRRIVNPGSVLLALDVAVELAADALELGDHRLDLEHPAAPLVDLKFLQANECLACLHRLVLPRRPRRRRAAPDPARASSHGPTAPAAAQCDGTTLAFGFRAAPGQDVDILAQDCCFFVTAGGPCNGAAGWRRVSRRPRGDEARASRRLSR